MKLKRTIFLLGILVWETIADNNHTKDVVILKKDSFDRQVAKMPHFVMFCVPW